jgi:lysine 2,3-aminomutase
MNPVDRESVTEQKISQPYRYPIKREFFEPDWRRLPAYNSVTPEQWRSAVWQRKHTVKNLKELKQVFGADT